MSTILCVDDNLDLANVIGEMLQALGHQVHLAESALGALEILAAESVDLLISDVFMPNMSGTELLQEVGRRGYPTAVILMSGSLDQKILMDALRLGVFEVLSKPFSSDVLRQAVQRALLFGPRASAKSRSTMLEPAASLPKSTS